MDSGVFENKQKIFEEKIIFFLRGYLIPLVGGTIVLLVLVFIYYPNITGLIADFSKYSQDNMLYSQVKSKITYYKNLSDQRDQLLLAANLVAVNQVIPDEAKSADTITLIQNQAQADGVSVASANAQLVGNTAATAVSLVKTVQVDLNVTGTPDNVRKLFTDITNMKQVIEITDTSMKGAVSGGGQSQVNFTIIAYAMSETDIASGANLLQPIITSYQTNDINKL